MAKKFLALIIGLTLSVVWQMHCIWAAEMSNTESNRSLDGLQTVYFKVEVISPDMLNELKKYGLTEDFLFTSISNRLQDAGITVLTAQQYQSSNTKALLQLSLRVIKPVTAKKYSITEEGIEFSTPAGKVSYLYAIKTDLYQSVLLQRSPDKKIMATTWQTGSSNIKPLAEIRADIRNHMDKFLLDYKAENQRDR